jgi:hypothetical protein
MCLVSCFSLSLSLTHTQIHTHLVMVVIQLNTFQLQADLQVTDLYNREPRDDLELRRGR